MTPTAPRCAAIDLSPAAARFVAALARVFPEGGRLGLAVSGGADSTAMLLLAHAAVPGRFEVATVDHGLRLAAAAECAHVAALCSERNIACTTLRVSVAAGNVQAEARKARYAALAEWASGRRLAAIATAHQADDQAETLLMRLARGSGVAGLAGIRERGQVPGSALPLLRPMLGFTRGECEAVCAMAGVAFVADPSNTDTAYDRVRARQFLQALPLGDAAAIAASASACADADAALDWAADREWAERVAADAGAIRYRPQAPRAIAIRIIARAVAELGGSLRGGQAAELADALLRGEGGNAGGVLARSVAADWVFSAEPKRRTG